MKLRNTILFLLAILVGFSTGCKTDELEKLRQENKEMKQTIEEKDSTIKELTGLYDKFEEKIQFILQNKEGVKLNFQDIGHEKARENLKNLRNALEENKKKISTLNTDLQSVRYLARKRKETVSELKTRIKMRKDSIRELSRKLKTQKIRIKGMLADLDKKDSTIHDFQKKLRTYEDSLNSKEKQLNTVYVAAMPEKKLEKKDIIKKKGGFLGFLGQTRVLNPEYEKDDFLKLNKEKQTSIPVNAREKDIELVTPHPTDSYALIEGDAGKTVLKITDKQKFWRAGNQLVVMY